MISIIQKRKIWYIFSGTLVLASILAVVIFGLRLGIDFTGGSLLEIKYSQTRPSPDQINQIIQENNIASVQIQAVGDNGYILRMPEIDDQTRRDILASLQNQIASDETEDAINKITEQQFEAIGPVIGQELKSKSVEAIIAVLIAIVLYIAWAFRKVSWPIKSWKYGVVAIITLFHDVLIMVGIFTILTRLFGWEVNTAFVAAILTILGYSVNDTIVVFDRIRENLPKISGQFEDIVNLSVNQTISRSINTSLTTLVVLSAIMIFGGDSIRSFIVALSIGVAVGTYSSIFIASPLLVSAQMLNIKKK